MYKRTTDRIVKTQGGLGSLTDTLNARRKLWTMDNVQKKEVKL